MPNTGNLTNGPTWVAGKFGGAVNFDGVDDYVDAGSGTSITDIGHITASAWIKLNSFGEGTFGRIIDNGMVLVDGH